MDIFLPEGFEAGRARAPMSRPASARKLSVEAEGVHYPVLRRWATGFAAAADSAPVLKGVVSLYDGSEYLHQCLITGHEGVEDQQVYSFRRAAEIDHAAQVDAT
ncbi:hypothetical protein [Sulfitobacter sp.]|uniref:hypothetical protein n=1 Tax=Sulfitobacter sp. TaxID=1903071 RepID=UPI00300111F6